MATEISMATTQMARVAGECENMERLAFVLPEFVRIAWVSDLARDTWVPRIHRIGAAWSHIEWLAVVEGVRTCAIVMVSPEGFLDQGPVWAGRGLCNLPVAMDAASNLSYRASSAPAAPGQPFEFRMVLGRPADVARFKEAWDASDHEAMGAMLGYPACCTRFFHDTWVDEGLVDTTWPMALRSTPAAAHDGATTLEVSGPPEANILWRWMGLRAAPHLPCRFDCAETVALGRTLMDVGRRAGYGEEMDWLLAILDWPVEWSALHGIAEIKTPILKVSTRTDATAVRYVVRRRGSGYPREGGRGGAFPYNVAPEDAAAPESDSGATPVRADWYASDNDFKSVEAMAAAHRPILELAKATLGDAGGAVLDLGCGNGALLAQLCAAAPGITPYGVEIRPERVAHAAELLPGYAANFVCGDIFTAQEIWPPAQRYALAILMPGRLIEAGPARGAYLCERIDVQCERLLVYAYDDWLTRYGGLESLAAAAGLTISDAGPGATCALVQLV
jgi:hypothetical protein